MNYINKNNFDQARIILIKQKKINDYILQDNNFIHICAMRGNNKLLYYITDKNIDRYLSNGKGEIGRAHV